MNQQLILQYKTRFYKKHKNKFDQTMDLDLESQKQSLIANKSDQLDHILTTKIGYGKAQHKLTIPLNILLFTQGCESVALGLLLPQLQREWQISAFEKSLLITLVYLGVSLGSYLQSYSDKYGRAVFIKWNAILQLIFGLLSCIAPNMNYFLFFRFVYGIGIGISFPLSATYMAEITPSDKRSTILTISRTYWSSGCLITCILAWPFLYDHRWKELLFVICLPGIYALYDHQVNGRESLRFLWANKRTSQVTQVLNYMAQLNQKEPISQQQIQYLIDHKQKKQIKQGQFKTLLNDKYRNMTLYLLFAWFSACFIYYGLLLLLPTILARNQSASYNFKYISLIVISVFEMACFYFTRILIDHPSFGRKRSTYLGFFVVGVCSLFLIVFEQSQTYVLMLAFIFMKIFITTTFMTLYPYTAQIYETLIRGKAMGIFSLIGRIATTVLGFVGVMALDWMDGKGLYVILMFLGIFSSLFMYKMPYCTLGRPLDT